MKCELEIKKVLFRSNLLRFSIKIGQECLPNHLKLKLNEKGTAKKEIKVKYKDGNLFDTTLTLAKNKGSIIVFELLLIIFNISSVVFIILKIYLYTLRVFKNSFSSSFRLISFLLISS